MTTRKIIEEILMLPTPSVDVLRTEATFLNFDYFTILEYEKISDRVKISLEHFPSKIIMENTCNNPECNNIHVFKENNKFKSKAYCLESDKEMFEFFNENYSDLKKIANTQNYSINSISITKDNNFKNIHIGNENKADLDFIKNWINKGYESDFFLKVCENQNCLTNDCQNVHICLDRLLEDESHKYNKCDSMHSIKNQFNKTLFRELGLQWIKEPDLIALCNRHYFKRIQIIEFQEHNNNLSQQSLNTYCAKDSLNNKSSYKNIEKIYICQKYLVDRSLCDISCIDLHLNKPYQWRIKSFRKRMSFKQSDSLENKIFSEELTEEIEKCFRKCHINSISICILGCDCVIEFDKMIIVQDIQIDSFIYTNEYEIERISTRFDSDSVNNLNKNKLNYWIWYYYEKNIDTWISFDKTDNLVCSFEVENIFHSSLKWDSNIKLNDYYEIDFSSMQLIKLSDLKAFKIVRRPCEDDQIESGFQSSTNKNLNFKDKNESSCAINNQVLIDMVQNLLIDQQSLHEKLADEKKDDRLFSQYSNDDDKVNLDLIETSLPFYWSQMDKEKEYDLVEIDFNNIDYQEIITSFLNSINDVNITIIKIERLQNPILYQHFVQESIKMKKKNLSVEIHQLYHGTRKENIELIAENNFDWRLSGTHVGHILGEGVYFAKHASIARKYAEYNNITETKFIFVANVLVGKYCLGDKSYRRPPKIPNTTREYFDSCVDNIIEPTVFTIYDFNKIYPAYLITYK